MSEFLKQMLDKMGEDGKDPESLGAHLAEAFDVGVKAYGKARQAVLDDALPYLKRGKLIEASMVMFAAVWMQVRWLEGGVRGSAEQVGGDDNPVKQMWELMEVALRAPDDAEAIKAMDKLRAEIKRGK